MHLDCSVCPQLPDGAHRVTRPTKSVFHPCSSVAESPAWNFVKGRLSPAAKFWLRPFSTFHFPSSILYPFAMFDTVKTDIAAAAQKLSHLRRFL
jgi:hypothetical protein